jgi:hypothetical protein
MAAIGSYVQDEAPQELEAFARYSEFESGEKLVGALVELLRGLGISEMLSQAAGSKDAILALRHEMVTPGRSDNFILPVTDTLLDHIVAVSWSE